MAKKTKSRHLSAVAVQRHLSPTELSPISVLKSGKKGITFDFIYKHDRKNKIYRSFLFDISCGHIGHRVANFFLFREATDLQYHRLQ